VLIGNPLTLTVIEFFAVPGALLGAALYPLGPRLSGCTP
jgi:competence protein ComEC